jgi:hypothetical protein
MALGPARVLMHFADLFDRNCRLPSLVDAPLLCSVDPAFWRLKLRSSSASIPSTVTRIGPATSVVANFASRTLRTAPLCRSPAQVEMHPVHGGGKSGAKKRAPSKAAKKARKAG